MSAVLVDYLAGAVTLGFFVAAAFFLRFWRRTHDRLFLAFAAAFVLLAVCVSMMLWTLLNCVMKSVMPVFTAAVSDVTETVVEPTASADTDSPLMLDEASVMVLDWLLNCPPPSTV